MKIGIIGVQGAVSEHTAILSTFNIQCINIRRPNHIENIDGLIIPGGESTTISNLIFSMYDRIKEKVINESLPIMGICAGCILLAKKIVNGSYKVRLLKLMDMEVQRNAFGRQRESFEANIVVDKFTGIYRGVFIRAPMITKVWGTCDPIAKMDDLIVGVRQKNLIAFTFHPELTTDTRIHELFINMCK